MLLGQLFVFGHRHISMAFYVISGVTQIVFVISDCLCLHTLSAYIKP